MRKYLLFMVSLLLIVPLGVKAETCNVLKEIVKNSYDYQARLEAFLMERVGNMFYDHHWKKRYEIPTVDI